MTLALAALAVAAGALAQAVSGIGFTLVSGPLLVGLLGQADGVRVSVVMSLALNALVLAPDVRHVRWPVLPPLLIPAALATPITAAALRHVDVRIAALLAGLVTMVGAALVASGRGWPGARSPAGAVSAGTVSGAMNVTAGVGGPAIALYADLAGWPGEQTRPTLQAYFLALNGVALVVLGPIAVSPVLWGAMGAGIGAGMIASRRVDQSMARRITLALAAVGGLAVVLRAVTSL